jgi:hypothetical protein
MMMMMQHYIFLFLLSSLGRVEGLTIPYSKGNRGQNRKRKNEREITMRIK